MKSLLPLAFIALLSAGAFGASEQVPAPPLHPTLETIESEAAQVPEPHPLLIAGIGSLAILTFAIRRK